MIQLAFNTDKDRANAATFLYYLCLMTKDFQASQEGDYLVIYIKST